MSTKIEIDLADLGFNYGPDGEPYQANITDLIIEAAARQIVRDGTHYEREVRERVGRIVDEEATTAVRGIVTEILTGPIQRRAPWGDKVGESTTVREIIREKVEEFLKAPKSRDSFGGSQVKNLTDLIEQEVGRALTADMQKVVKEAKSKVHETVTQRALAAAVKELAR